MTLGSGATSYVTVSMQQSTAKSEGLAAIIKWRQDALDNGVLWGGQPMRQYLASQGIAEADYLNPQWSYDMERVAIQRAVEAWDDADNHTRPNGDGTFSVASEGVTSQHEVLAYNPGGFTAAVNAWAEEKSDYVAQTGKETGHYEYLINPSHLGYGLGLSDSKTYGHTIAGEAILTAPTNQNSTGWSGACEFQVNLSQATLQSGSPTLNPDHVSVGQTAQVTVSDTVYNGRYEIRGQLSSQDATIAQVVQGLSASSPAQVKGVAPGSTTLTLTSGTLSLPMAFTVTAASIASVDTPADVTTPSGTAPTLPPTVRAHYDNGTDADLPVTWAAVDPSAYSARNGGTFTVQGTVAGWSQPVTQTVVVTPATVVSTTPVTVSTKAGVAPVLPAQVSATWSNGDQAPADVTWDAIDPAQYAQGGTFTVAGTVGGQAGLAKATVNVDRSIVSVMAPDPVTTPSGTAPQLPATVTATWSDGATSQEPVTWASVDRASYSTRKASQFQVSGTVAGVKDPVSITVDVQAAYATAVDLQPVRTLVGVAPTLPSTVNVTWSNGDHSTETATWNTVDPTSYAAPGSFDAAGSLPGVMDQISVRVDVVAGTIVRVIQPDAVTTPSGTRPTLPTTVQAVLSSDPATGAARAAAEQIVTVPVTWQQDYPDTWKNRLGGSFVVNGAVENYTGPVTIAVNVTPATVTAVDPGTPVKTPSGIAPSLPDHVAVTWSNGEQTSEPVQWADNPTWKNRDGGQYDASGTIFTGTANERPVTLGVTVTPATKLTLVAPEPVTTTVGTAPVLPATVQQAWTNGDQTPVDVAWDAVDPASYATPGQFVVNGVADGQPVQVTVTVTEVSAEPAPTPNQPDPSLGESDPARPSEEPPLGATDAPGSPSTLAPGLANTGGRG